MSARNLVASFIVAVALVITAPPSNAALDILYNFDHPLDTGHASNAGVVNDNIVIDGTQNASLLNFGAPPRSLGSGIGGTAGVEFHAANVESFSRIQTDAGIEYPNAFTWSAAVKPVTTPSSGETDLFWTGDPSGGTGAALFYVSSAGQLGYTQLGGMSAVTTSTNNLALNTYQYLGVTFDGAVGGGTLTFYRNGAVVQSFAGLGSLLNNGHGTDNVTDFGEANGLGGATTSRFIGFADDIRISDRALSAAEMATLQAVPEPAALGVLAVAGAITMTTRRARKN